MKKLVFLFIPLLSVCCLTNNIGRVNHDDPFYNYDPLGIVRIPLIKPIDVTRLDSSSPWELGLLPSIWIEYPNIEGYDYFYFHVPIDKFAVHNDIIMAYSAYINQDADPFIWEDYYHWFVMIPDEEITEGFHIEDDFIDYIQTQGIEEPNWRIPHEVYKEFEKTGCLEWIPGCE